MAAHITPVVSLDDSTAMDVRADGKETKDVKDSKDLKDSKDVKRSDGVETGDEEKKADNAFDPESVDDNELKLVAKCGGSVAVRRRNICAQSGLVKTTVLGEPSCTEVPVPSVSLPVLVKIAEYVGHHGMVVAPIVEKPLRSKVMKDVCKDEWDAKYIDDLGENRQALYDYILGTNYMDMQTPLHLGCAKVASLIKGQPLEKIKEILTGTSAASTSSSSSATTSSFSSSSSVTTAATTTPSSSSSTAAPTAK